MATFRVHLRSYKLDSSRELRYLTIGPNKELGFRTPLFLGADILTDSHVSTSNHCRIHTRYSRKGLATKVTFPESVSITGVTNCHSGAWFYNVQGVFQVIFELVPRSTQLKVVKMLWDLWQEEDNCQPLPERLHATLEELSVIREPFNLSPLQSELDQVLQVGMEAEVATCLEDEELPPATAATSPPSWLPQLLEVRAPAATLGRCTLWWWCHALIAKMQALVDEGGHRLRDLQLARALLACLRLVRFEARSDRGDDLSVSFLEDVLTRFAETAADPVRLREFVADDEWGLSSRQNALLCTVAEWLGKRLHPFVDRIGTRADVLRAEHHHVTRPPVPAHLVIDRLFPECMQLLVGYWIGLYGTKVKVEGDVDDADVGDPISRVEVIYATDDTRLYPRRADHSYSNSRREVSTTAATEAGPVAVAVKTRVDHSYSFAVSSAAAFGGGLPTEGQTTQHLPPVRDDHTYVAASPGDAAAPSEASGGPRKDHTYVSTRKVPTSVAASAQSATFAGGGGSKESPHPQAKRLKTSTACESRLVSEPRKVVLDPAKYRVAQLNLEFLNRVPFSELTPLLS